VPFFALGDVQAGFAPGAVWLSKTHVTANDDVVIYTVVYNSANSPIKGTVSFLVDREAIVTKDFALEAGTSKIESAQWSTTEGSHTIAASLKGVVNAETGEHLSLERVATESVAIEVAAPPTPSPTEQAISVITKAAEVGTPIVIQTAQSAYNSLEYLRQNAVRSLEGALASAQDSSGVGAIASGSDQEVLGTSTSNVSHTATDTVKSGGFLGMLWQKTLSFLLFIARFQLLFYALLVLVLYLLFALLRTALFERRHPFSRY